MRFSAAFDNWLSRGPFDARGLAAYRIGYATIGLLTMVDLQWLIGMPNSFYNPPPGPFALLSGFPPDWALLGLEIMLPVLLVLLMFGLFTKPVSIAVSVVLMMSYGFSYSLGNVSHTILFALVPGFLAFSGWGMQLSLDSQRRRKKFSHVNQWALRLFAIAIGVAFMTAALPKILSGWLDWSQSATYGQLLRRNWTGDSVGLIPDTVLSLESWRWLWESADWATVALESLMILSVLSWRSFRIMIAAACLFHLGVLLVFQIPFTNVVAYGAFVSWGMLLPQSALRTGGSASITTSAPWSMHRIRSILLCGIAIAGLAWSLSQTVPQARVAIETFLVFVGALVAVGYLGLQLLVLRQWWEERSVRDLAH